MKAGLFTNTAQQYKAIKGDMQDNHRSPQRRSVGNLFGRPQGEIKMRCHAKRLWPKRTWGGTGKTFSANCLLRMTDYFYETSATCGKNNSRKAADYFKKYRG